MRKMLFCVVILVFVETFAYEQVIGRKSLAYFISHNKKIVYEHEIVQKNLKIVINLKTQEYEKKDTQWKLESTKNEEISFKFKEIEDVMATTSRTSGMKIDLKPKKSCSIILKNKDTNKVTNITTYIQIPMGLYSKRGTGTVKRKINLFINWLNREVFHWKDLPSHKISAEDEQKIINISKPQ